MHLAFDIETPEFVVDQVSRGLTKTDSVHNEKLVKWFVQFDFQRE